MNLFPEKMWFQEISESTSHSNLFIKGMPFMNTLESHYSLIHSVQNIYFHSRYITIISHVSLYMKYCNHCALTGTSIVGWGGGVGFQWNKRNVLQLNVNSSKI